MNETKPALSISALKELLNITDPHLFKLAHEGLLLIIEKVTNKSSSSHIDSVCEAQVSSFAGMVTSFLKMTDKQNIFELSNIAVAAFKKAAREITYLIKNDPR
jgi:hypothetical protein